MSPLDRVAVYDLQGSEIRADQYLYFAASIFWRAAATSWHHDGRLIDRISLGAKYQEEFRAYLLGEAAFPSNGRMFVYVWRGSSSASMSAVPCSERVSGVLRHKFWIPGIGFILFLGSDAKTRFDLGALNGANGSHMWFCPFEDDSVVGSFSRLIKQATFAQAMRRHPRSGG